MTATSEDEAEAAPTEIVPSPTPTPTPPIADDLNNVDLSLLTGGIMRLFTDSYGEMDWHRKNKWTTEYSKIYLPGENFMDRYSDYRDLIDQRNTEERSLFKTPIPNLPDPPYIADRVPFFMFMSAETDQEVRALWRMVHAAEQAYQLQMRATWSGPNVNSKYVFSGTGNVVNEPDIKLHVSAYVNQWLAKTRVIESLLLLLAKSNKRLEDLIAESAQWEREIRDRVPNVLHPTEIFAKLFNSKNRKDKSEEDYEDFKFPPASQHDVGMYGEVRDPNTSHDKPKYIYNGCLTCLYTYDECTPEKMELVTSLAAERIVGVGVKDQIYYNGEKLLPLIHICLGKYEVFKKFYMVKPILKKKEETSDQQEEVADGDDNEFTYVDASQAFQRIPTRYYTMSGLLEFFRRLLPTDRHDLTLHPHGISPSLQRRIIDRVTNQPAGTFSLLVTILDHYGVEKHLFHFFENIGDDNVSE